MALWRISESKEELMDLLQPETSQFLENIHAEQKQLQRIASRILVKQLIGPSADIVYDEFRKPLLKEGNAHVSISHSSDVVAVMVSTKQPVGIDVELVAPKIERIKYKFMQEWEVDSIPPSRLLEQLYVYWCAKEALYKRLQVPGISFRNGIYVAPFELHSQGTLSAKVKYTSQYELTAYYELFDNYVFVYV